MDPIKLTGIRDWPSPTTVKQTRSFLGFGNYYRRFISGFAEIARPLHELTKKDKYGIGLTNVKPRNDYP
jgi:hypothetical protein